MTGNNFSKPMAGLCRWAMRAALAGLTFSAVVHASTFVAPVSLDTALPLHFGAIILGVPMVVVASVASQGQTGVSLWTFLQACPPWLRYGAVGLTGYALINLFLLFTGQISDLQGMSAVWQCGYASIAAVYHAVGKRQVA